MVIHYWNIDISPNYATAHQWYAELLSPLGRHEEAIKEMQYARELDPLSMIINHNLGMVYYFAQKYDEAELFFKEALTLDENNWVIRNTLEAVQLESNIIWQIKNCFVKLSVLIL